MIRNPLISRLLLLTLVAAYVTLHFWQDPASDTGFYLLNLIPLYMIYFLFVYYALKSPEDFSVSLRWFIGIAIVVRIIVIFSPVFLSDDVFRYLWDGRVSRQGINPYSYPPDSESLFNLRETEIYPHINFPGIATIYPPLAQLLFLINTYAGDSLFSWKIILFALEMLMIFVLSRLIGHFSLNPYRLLIVLLNPLLIIETYQSGHLDIAGISVFWISVLLFYRQKDTGSLLFFLGSALIKFFPLVTCLPFLLKRFWRKAPLLVLLVVIFILPFSATGTVPMAGFFSYANRWSFNNVFFMIASELFRLTGIPSQELFHLSLQGTEEIFYFSPVFVYKILALAVLIVLMIDQMRKLKITADYRSINFLQASFFTTGLLLLLSPTLHPWYILWIIPFLIFLPNWSWLFFTFLVQLSYFVLIDYARSGIWRENIWIVLVEFIPFLTLLAFEYFDRRSVRGWFLNRKTASD